MELHDKIEYLLEKYSKNEYVLGKLNNYILNVLPNILEEAEQTNIQRIERRNKLIENSDIFVEKFLRVNKYFYCQRNELFMHYDDTHFIGYSEDDIQHQILTKITSEKTLMPWKHKMKQHIIKRIKERNPLNVIPETNTIQFVLKQIYPSIFSSRNSAKHFLTAIGDNIMNNLRGHQEMNGGVKPLIKSSRQIIYIVPSNIKELLREIEYLYYTYFGNSGLLNNFKYKYYEHEYAMCRFLSLNKQDIPHTLTHLLSKNIMDLFCVCKHYSKRYGSADGFIERINDNELTNYVGFLKNKTPELLVSNFIDKSLNKCSNCSIKTNSMIYVWKKYLQSQNIPNIIFYDTLLTIFKQLLEYDNETDCFKNITSIHLPFVSQFTLFWDTSFQEDENAPELEIDELLYIIKKIHPKMYNHLNYEIVIELLHNLYPDVAIEDNKYIMNVFCKVWDKKEEIKNFLSIIKEKTDNHPKSIHDMYELYTSDNKKNNFEIKVSKRCFEKIIIELLGNYIDLYGEIDDNYWTDTTTTTATTTTTTI
jgi:hypothetical protein